MYILNIYRASFDSDYELCSNLEPKCVSSNFDLLKEKLLDILSKSNINLSSYHLKQLHNNNNSVKLDFDNGSNKFDWDDIVAIEITKIIYLK